MRISLSWLREYVPVDGDVDQLADRLTMVGLEVDSVWDRFADLDHVRVGKIVSVRPHPNADKLRICEVDIGDRSVTVVCGAPNVKEGLVSALALPGTRLADGTRLERSVIRGETSEGMLCSEAELGLGDDRSGIMALRPESTPGSDMTAALSLSDTVFELDLTPNRPDCLCFLGIAREIAAIQKTPMVYPEIRLVESTDPIASETSVTIDAPGHCPRYAARLVVDVRVGPSPAWLQDRLLSVGLRPINNIVDVTNFVMMETGQPLHAFDFDRLADRRIVVRTAEPGEAFVTLDGKEHRLDGDTLMICDGEKPVAIGGVMGGLNSEIDSETTRVLIESAYFNPVSIRRTAKKLGMGTDASHRFERGVDPEGTLNALNRAAQLITELGQGQLMAGAIDAHPTPVHRKSILLSTTRTNRLLGIALERDAMAGLLTSIEFSVEPVDDDRLQVTAPSFRVDVSRPEDLMEEVARLSGYNAIPETTPKIPAEGRPLAPALQFREQIRRLITGLGFSEAITYSFAANDTADRLRLKPEDPRRRTLAILNPLTEEQTVMRTSLIPGLLAAAQLNLSHRNRRIRLFEIGKIFISRGQTELPEEIEMLAGLWSGPRYGESWLTDGVESDFYDVKGVVEALFGSLHITTADFVAMPADACTYTRAGQTAEIVVDGAVIGVLGAVAPEILDAFDLKQGAFLFELDGNALMRHAPASLQARPIPRFPSVARDVTLIVDDALAAGRILRQIQDAGEELVESASLFDVFWGKPVPPGKKSLSFRIIYRSHEKTLEDEAVNQVHARLSQRIIDAFSADLPG